VRDQRAPHFDIKLWVGIDASVCSLAYIYSITVPKPPCDICNAGTHRPNSERTNPWEGHYCQFRVSPPARPKPSSLSSVTSVRYQTVLMTAFTHTWGPLIGAALLDTSQNQLIELLPDKARRRILGIAEQVQLVQSAVLGGAGEPTRYVYFPINGFISLVTSIDGKPVLEVGMVGREGMCGAQVALRVLTQPLHALVQGAGTAWRMPISAFRRELDQCAPLQSIIGRYLYVLMSQLACAAACTRFHQIDARLGRWLLMMHDRAHGDTFGVTQEFLSFMLGVRRVGISAAAASLHRKGLIKYSRGRMTLLDRKGLEAVSCSCYAQVMHARIVH
jgi:CRP-like cAMP-binding protein